MDTALLDLRELVERMFDMALLRFRCSKWQRMYWCSNGLYRILENILPALRRDEAGQMTNVCRRYYGLMSILN